MKRNACQAKKAGRAVRLARIARSDLGSGDVLVIRTGAHVSPGTLDRIVAHLGCRVLVLPVDARLDVVRADAPLFRVDKP